MRSLTIAAGGGGDALGAVMVNAALGSDSKSWTILTFAWERLRVDPLPGPRSAQDFSRLRPVGQHNMQVCPETTVKPPSRSTLPRLADEIDAAFILLDPARGARGLRRQITEMVDRVRPDVVRVVDIGGDAVARGDEKSLRSPLADALVLAACSDLPVRAELFVAGPGLDGELTEQDVVGRVAAFRGERVRSLDSRHAALVMKTLRWHPSEVTALLAASSLGRRGRVEIRDRGTVVDLTGESANVYSVDIDRVGSASLIVPRLRNSRSLAEAEEVIRAVRQSSEIDYEREKAGRVAVDVETDYSPADLVSRVDTFTRDAAQRGIDFVTYRRLAEAVAAPHIDIECLRTTLLRCHPEQDAAPLWATKPSDPTC